MKIEFEHPEDSALQRHAEGTDDPGIAAHAAACQECRDKVEAYGRLFAALEAPLTAPPALFHGVMAAVAREKATAAAPAPFTSFLPRAFAVAAAAAALFLALYWTDAPATISGGAEAAFSSAADVIVPDAAFSPAVEETLAGAFSALDASLNSAASAGDLVLEPLKSYSLAPLFALAGLFVVNAAAYFSLRRGRRGEFQS